MTAVRHQHTSGKHSGDPQAFARYVTRARHDVGTATEAKGSKWTRALASELGGDYWVRTAGEFPIWGRHDICRPGPGTLRRLTFEHPDRDDWRDAWVHYRWVRFDTGPVLYVVVHLSSAVQSGGRWSGFRRGVRSHREATRKIGAQVRRRRRLAEAAGLPAPRVVVCGDVNLDLHRAVWRRRMRKALGVAGMWDTTRPRGGTHGRRLIDGIWSTAPIVGARLAPPPPGGFDHRGVIATYQLDTPGRVIGRHGRRRNTRPGRPRAARPTYTATHGSTR